MQRSSEVEEKLIKKLAATVAKEGAKDKGEAEKKKPVYDMWGQEEKKGKKRKKKGAQVRRGEEERGGWEERGQVDVAACGYWGGMVD